MFDPSTHTLAVADEEGEIDLSALLATLWQRRVTIIGAVVIALALTAGNLLGTRPTYQADSMLQIGDANSGLALPETMSELLGRDQSKASAELEILKSRQVLGRAVAQLNLDWDAHPVQMPIIAPAKEWLFPHLLRPAIKMGFLDVPYDWLGQTMELTKTAEGAFRVALPDGTAIEGQVGRIVAAPEKGFGLTVTRLDGSIGQAYRVTHLSERAAVLRLGSSLTAAEKGKDTGIITVSLTGPNPTDVAIMLDAVVAAYVEQNIARSAAEAQKSLDFVSSQMPEAQAQLAAAEKALNDYRARQKSVDLQFETQSLLTETTSVETQLRALALKENEIKQKYTSNHPLYRELLDQRAELQKHFDELQASVSNLPETQREVVNLTRNLDLAQTTYFGLVNRAQELKVLSASQIGTIRVIDRAEAQESPVAPRSSRALGIGLLAGLILGVATVVVTERLRRGVDNPQQIERAGVPVFATINLHKVKADTNGKRNLVALTHPEGLVVEALRSLRTSLHFAMLDGNARSLALTSSAPGAGKSFIAANLAVIAAKAGQRVCLVDADMRRGTQRRYFDLPRDLPGLSDFLAGDMEPEVLLRNSEIENLSLMMTGPIPPNPSELLMQSRLAELISALDSRFDLVIFDTPPALAVTDAVIIGRQVSTTLAVVRHDVTPLGEVEDLRDVLKSSGVKLAGGILNGFDQRRARGRAGGYGYGYGYRYTYRSDKG